MATGNLDERRINEIVDKVVTRLAPALSKNMGPATNPAATPSLGSHCGETPPLVNRGPALHSGRMGLFDDVDSAVSASRAAHEHLVHRMTLSQRNEMIAATRA